MENIADLVTHFVINALMALAIFVVGRWIAFQIANILQKTLLARNMDTALVHFVRSLAYWALLVFVLIAALGQLGLQTASFVAIVGAAGLAIGLALQGSLSNFASGILLLFFKPFKAGDFVEVANTAGSIEKIQIFTTELVTPDNKQIIIPNSAITSGTITNYSAKDTRRVDLTIGISYDDDIDKARELIFDEISKDERILKDPEPVVLVMALADSSVNFAVRSWAATSDYWPIYTSLTESIKKRFDKDGISIPYPQTDVHIHQVKE
ncbi:MAG: mechanosensitive ion channel [Pseudomonadales bacterium]